MPYKAILAIEGILVGKCVTVTGTLVHTCSLLPDLWVCKPLQATYGTSSFIKYFLEKSCILYIINYFILPYGHSFHLSYTYHKITCYHLV